MKVKFLKIFIPWVITAVALYLAFRAVEWVDLWAHLKGASPLWLLLAVCLTFLSYIFRARRWEFFFAEKTMTLIQSWRVLILGFFMNNVLPARAGEIVRAHLGSRVTGLTRTHVLATIASERLADGVTLSAMFIGIAFWFGDGTVPKELSYVAYLFALATAGVGFLLIMRDRLFRVIERIEEKLGHKMASYTLSRVKIFVEGLRPLYDLKKLPAVTLWSIFIWLIELSAFISVGQAFRVVLPYEYFVLFMVTVNFSSLIPAAPGGIGVIEAVTSAVLVAVGVDRELALAMVLVQHVIQYLMVGIPGAILLITWKGSIKPDQESGV